MTELIFDQESNIEALLQKKERKKYIQESSLHLHNSLARALTIPFSINRFICDL